MRVTLLLHKVIKSSLRKNLHMTIMIKGLKKDEKDTLVSFGIGDFGDEIGMLTEISTLQDIELFCMKRRLKIKKKLDKFREKRKNDR